MLSQVQLFAPPPGSSLHGILLQECWSGFHFPLRGSPDPGVSLCLLRLLHCAWVFLLLRRRGCPALWRAPQLLTWNPVPLVSSTALWEAPGPAVPCGKLGPQPVAAVVVQITASGDPTDSSFPKAEPVTCPLWSPDHTARTQCVGGVTRGRMMPPFVQTWQLGTWKERGRSQGRPCLVGRNPTQTQGTGLLPWGLRQPRRFSCSAVSCLAF